MSLQNPSLLLDHSIITNSSCFEWTRTTLNGDPPREGGRENLLLQIVRKEADSNLGLQSEFEAVYPLGKFIREGRGQATKSWELMMEGMRDYMGKIHWKPLRTAKLVTSHLP